MNEGRDPEVLYVTDGENAKTPTLKLLLPAFSHNAGRVNDFESVP